MSTDTPTTPRPAWEQPKASSLAVHRLTADDLELTITERQAVLHLGGFVDVYGTGETHGGQLDGLEAIGQAVLSLVGRERRRLAQSTEAGAA